jgi:hypothetical protein
MWLTLSGAFLGACFGIRVAAHHSPGMSGLSLLMGGWFRRREIRCLSALHAIQAFLAQRFADDVFLLLTV